MMRRVETFITGSHLCFLNFFLNFGNSITGTQIVNSSNALLFKLFIFHTFQENLSCHLIIWILTALNTV
ncbi:MAG: hypothetical protein K0Q67_992 [Cellvibrio sp.]|jgi:hypothetical protein|nr:hypothetical protein [Cellvibrio sp.]MDF3011929.1 hypothetical protein [Cellvibrio sp.]